MPDENSQNRAEILPVAFSENSRLRLLIDSIVDYAVYMLDADGNVVSWNAGAQRFKGYTEAEILGRHFSTFYLEEDRLKQVPQRALRTAESEGKFEAEGWRVRKDGTSFWAHVLIDPIRDPEGRLLGFAKVTRDLTERLETQRELELAREELGQSQKLEAIGQLTGGVAHDFNNLLTVVIGSLEILRKRMPQDASLLTLLDNAMQAARRGSTLTERMLAFARRKELKPEQVDVVQLVRDMSDLLDRALGPSIALDLDFEVNLGKVLIDANQLEMALLNLALNARDAMPKGGVIRIQGRARLNRNNEPFLKLSVIDSGHGMTPEILSRAMDPFFTTKGVGKGTGLGLSMVHGFAEQAGGRFVLESELDKGTKASLWLPLARKDVLRTADAKEASSASERQLVILAVDDDFLVLASTVAMLEDLGHRVTAAHSGKEALSALKEGSFDLVIVDQAMPHMTGTELIERIRADNPAQPVLLASGYAELDSDSIKISRLSKPFLQHQLALAVQKAIER